MFFRPPKNLAEYGSWALITGSTDGIGKALAFELASKGLNLVLVGRNPLKLENTCNEIRKAHGEQVEIKTVILDFTKSSGEHVAEAIEEAITGLDVGILVNNVGLGYPYAKFFHEIDLEMTESLIRVNIDGTTRVTGAVLPGMLKKKKGAIVNMFWFHRCCFVIPSLHHLCSHQSVSSYFLNLKFQTVILVLNNT